MQIIKNCGRTLMINCFVSIIIVGCNGSEIKTKHTITEKPITINALPDTTIIENPELQAVKPDTQKTNSSKAVATKKIKQEQQSKVVEGLSDNKMNGEIILIHIELPQNIFAANPDTIKNYLRREYLNMERNFPRSIADNFEKGTSTERISYPKLNFRVELFKNKYSEKPYRILGYSVRKEKDAIIVE